MGPNIVATMGKSLCLFRYLSQSYREKADSREQCHLALMHENGRTKKRGRIAAMQTLVR